MELQDKLRTDLLQNTELLDEEVSYTLKVLYLAKF